MMTKDEVFDIAKDIGVINDPSWEQILAFANAIEKRVLEKFVILNVKSIGGGSGGSGGSS
jgi:hypothetical protein